MKKRPLDLAVGWKIHRKIPQIFDQKMQKIKIVVDKLANKELL